VLRCSGSTLGAAYAGPRRTTGGNRGSYHGGMAALPGCAWVGDVSGVMTRAASAVQPLRAYIEARQAERGMAYPWWLPIFGFLGMGFCVVVGLAQRDAYWPLDPLLLTLLLVPGPCVLDLVRYVPWPVSMVSTVGGTVWLLSVPADSGPVDFAPTALAFLVAEVTAKAVRPGLITAAVSTATVIVGDALWGLRAVEVHALEALLGLVIGYLLLWQMRALRAEQEARAGERERATLAERQRVAREVHDLTGHSLSVVLLHLTAARRALTEEGGIPEAADALEEAERVGRQAMTDVRRTLGLLPRPDAATEPVRSGADVADLVAGMRRAGLAVDLSVSGDLGAVDGPLGLCVYRVLQESLANVAHHAPGAPARVRVEVTDREVRAEVRNDCSPVLAPVGAGPTRGTGSGVAGMAARAEQLGGRVSAGVQRGEWVVDVRLPRECP